MYAASFLAGYVGLVVAAVVTGIEFGVQPLIASAPDGAPLYAPYPLSIAVPAMAAGHMLFLGPVEGLITMLLAGYFLEIRPAPAHETHAPGMTRLPQAALVSTLKGGVMLPGWNFQAGGSLIAVHQAGQQTAGPIAVTRIQ